jgi:hypothetical protein
LIKAISNEDPLGISAVAGLISTIQEFKKIFNEVTFRERNPSDPFYTSLTEQFMFDIRGIKNKELREISTRNAIDEIKKAIPNESIKKAFIDEINDLFEWDEIGLNALEKLRSAIISLSR